MAIPDPSEDIIAAEGSAYLAHFQFPAPSFSWPSLTTNTQMLPFLPFRNEDNLIVPIVSNDSVGAEGSAYPPYLLDQGFLIPSETQNTAPTAIAPFQDP